MDDFGSLIDPRFPRDWYWRASDGRLYSSAAQDLVDENDATFTAWTDAGGLPTTWPRNDAGTQTEAALVDVLTPYGIYVSRKAAKSAAVNAKRDAILADGYHHPFGGTIGTRILDQRGPEDTSNWIALKLMAQDMNSDGQGDTLLPIRDANNATFQAKASVIEGAMGDMGKWRAGILGRSWALKDAIAAAADQAALDAIDIDTGWE